MIVESFFSQENYRSERYWKMSYNIHWNMEKRKRKKENKKEKNKRNGKRNQCNDNKVALTFITRQPIPEAKNEIHQRRRRKS